MRKPSTISKVVNFDPTSLKAPVILRSAAFFIDYVLIVMCPVVALVFGRLIGNDGSKLLNSEISSLGWVLALLTAVANLFFLPFYTGQSLGKMITGLKVVAGDGRPPSLKVLALRHTVGYLVTVLTLGVGFIFALTGRTGRTLHDRLFGTYVIYAEPKPLSDTRV